MLLLQSVLSFMLPFPRPVMSLVEWRCRGLWNLKKKGMKDYQYSLS